ncbi:MAG: hypothetical protein V1495_05775 [Pseudomonadota bacterium]
MSDGKPVDPRIAAEFARNRRRAIVIGSTGVALVAGALIVLNAGFHIPLDRHGFRLQSNVAILILIGFAVWASRALRCPACKKGIRSFSARACPTCGALLCDSRVGDRRGKPVHYNIHDPEFFRTYLSKIRTDLRGANSLNIWGRVLLTLGPVLFIALSVVTRRVDFLFGAAAALVAGITVSVIAGRRRRRASRCPYCSQVIPIPSHRDWPKPQAVEETHFCSSCGADIQQVVAALTG